MAIPNATASNATPPDHAPYDRLVELALIIAQTRHSPKSGDSASAASSAPPPCDWKDRISDHVGSNASVTIEVCAVRLGNSGHGRHSPTTSEGMPNAELNCPRSGHGTTEGVLLERWTLDILKSGPDTRERPVRLCHLHQAVTSTLHFSQLQSWLKLTGNRWNAAIHYNILNSHGDDSHGAFSSVHGPTSTKPKVNCFPVACIGGEHNLRARCVAMPNNSEIPFSSPSLLQFVADRRQAACKQQAASATVTVQGQKKPDSDPNKPRPNKRRSKSLKEGDLQEKDDARHLCDGPPDPCPCCGAVIAPWAGGSGERKRRPHSRSNGSSPELVLSRSNSGTSLQMPVQPAVRVKSPPRPISPSVQRQPECTADNRKRSPQRCQSPSGAMYSYVNRAPLRQKSAPAQSSQELRRRSSSGTISSSPLSSSPLSQSSQGSASSSLSSNSGLSASSLLRNHSLARITCRKISLDGCCIVGSPYPSTVPTAFPSGQAYRRGTSWPGPLSTSPLLGTFEESMFAGRLASVNCVEGYQLQLRSWCAQCKASSSTAKLDLQTEFFSTDSGAPSPYLGIAPSPHPAFRVPSQGNLQALLYRPSGSVMRIFVVPYDLTPLGAGEHTFVRQRTVSCLGNGALKPSLLYAIHFSLRRTGGGALLLHKDIRLVFSPVPPDTFDISSSSPRGVLTETLGPHIPTHTKTGSPGMSEVSPVSSYVSTGVTQQVSAARNVVTAPVFRATATTPSTVVVANSSTNNTAPLLSAEEMHRKKQEAAAAVAWSRANVATPPPNAMRVP